MEKLMEAFQELQLLEEDVFNITADGVEEVRTFMDTPEDEFDIVIDPEADTEEELKDTYIGKVIEECVICQSKIYRDPEEINIDEEGLSNVGQECPYCLSVDGFTVIGEVAEFNPNTEITVDEEGVYTEPETEEQTANLEDEEKLEESLKDELKNKSKFYKKGFKQGRDAYESGTSLTWKQGSPLSELKAGDILDIDDLDEADEKVSDKDAKEFLAGHQAGMDYQAERLNESRKLKENKDFNVFTEIEYDNIWDWHEDDESLYGKDGKFGLIVTGNRNFQEFFYVRERLEDIKEAFEEYDGQELLDKLKEITGKEYVETQFSGYSQGDWQNAYYPKDEFTDERIKILNDSYMGKYQVFEDIDGDTFVVYDSLNKSIKDQIAEEAGVPVEKIRIKSISGYTQTPNYIEESRKLNERLSREDWDVINDAVKYVIKNHEKITGKPLSAIFNEPSNDARPLFNQDVIDEINSKVKEAVQIKFPELKDRTMFEEFLYKLDEDLIDYAPRLDESKKLNEDTNVLIKTDDKEIKIDTEDGDVDVKVEEKENKETGDEMIAPLNQETEDKFEKEIEVEFDEFEQDRFDDLQERYFKENFSNVKSYKTTLGRIRGNSLILEGLIEFKSGNKKKTTFVYESNTITKDNKLKFIGENKQFTNRNKAFLLTGEVKENKLMVESLSYDHTILDTETKELKRLNGNLK